MFLETFQKANGKIELTVIALKIRPHLFCRLFTVLGLQVYMGHNVAWGGGGDVRLNAR